VVRGGGSNAQQQDMQEVQDTGGGKPLGVQASELVLASHMDLISQARAYESMLCCGGWVC
jgi:hypothetical protein